MMNRYFVKILLVFIVLSAACNLHPAISPCPGSVVIKFPDAKLEEHIRYTIKKPSGAICQCDVTNITELDVVGWYRYDTGVNDLSGIENLTSLTKFRLLNFDGNIEPLAKLPSLAILTVSSVRFSLNHYLPSNRLPDLSPLKNSTTLTETFLYCPYIGNINTLANITSLKCLTIRSLPLFQTPIPKLDLSDISVLATLPALEHLEIYSTNISDISALANLTNLKFLFIDDSNISDISALANLTKLNSVYLPSNNISDISTLLNINFEHSIYSVIINLSNNPLSAVSIDTYIPELKKKNIHVFY